MADPTYFYTGGTGDTPRKFYAQNPGENMAKEIDPIQNPLGNLSTVGDNLISSGKINPLPANLLTVPIGATVNQGSTNITNPPPGGPVAPPGSPVAPQPTPASDVSKIISAAANPELAGLKPVDSSSPDIQKFSADQKAALDAAKAAKYKAIDEAMTSELTKLTNTNKNTLGMVRNKLAELGILDTSTASVQYIHDTEADAAALESATRAKYDIQKMDVDAATQQALIDAINKQIKDTNDRINTRIDQLQKGAGIAADFYKTLSDAEAKAEQNKLDREKLQIEDAYNKGRLTIDAYNSKITENKNQQDALAKSRELAIKGYEAETNRMKVQPANTIPYPDWIAQQQEKTGSSIDATDPRWKAKYYQENPITLKQLNASLNTEQASRKEVVQDMVDKGEIGLEQAQMIHPDIAPLLKRKGASALEKLMYDVSGYSSAQDNTGGGGGGTPTE